MGNRCCHNNPIDSPLILSISEFPNFSQFTITHWPQDTFLQQQLKNIRIPQLHNHQIYQLQNENLWFYGSWHDQIPMGFGVLFIQKQNEKIFYEGDFNRVPHGQGKAVLYPSYIEYRGEIQKGKAEGRGILKGEDYQFNGVWKQSEPFMGIYKFKQGIIEKQEETTKILYQDGRKYSGRVNNKLQPHGLGQIIFNDQSKYTGQWNQGEMHGQGQFSWPDSSSYKGTYFCGYKNGFGTYTFKTGCYYRGYWQQGYKHGRGQYYDADNNRIVQGQWKNDILQSQKLNKN